MWFFLTLFIRFVNLGNQLETVIDLCTLTGDISKSMGKGFRAGELIRE